MQSGRFTQKDPSQLEWLGFVGYGSAGLGPFTLSMSDSLTTLVWFGANLSGTASLPNLSWTKGWTDLDAIRGYDRHSLGSMLP